MVQRWGSRLSALLADSAPGGGDLFVKWLREIDCAVTVDEGIEGYRASSIPMVAEACRSRGIEHRVVSIKDIYGMTVDEMARMLNLQREVLYRLMRDFFDERFRGQRPVIWGQQAAQMELAEALQTPAIVLSDQFMGQSRAVIDRPAKVDGVARRLTAAANAPEYKRYRNTATGVSPMAIPGTAGVAYTADGLEHSEGGIPSSQARDHGLQLDKRLRKLAEHVKAGVRAAGATPTVSMATCWPATSRNRTWGRPTASACAPPSSATAPLTA